MSRYIHGWMIWWEFFRKARRKKHGAGPQKFFHATKTAACARHMGEERYMDGRGINERTRNLESAMWANINGAILGSTLATCGPIIAIVFFSVTSGNHPAWDRWLLTVVVSIACAAVGIWMGEPYRRALRAIKQHTAEMRAETAKRGSGWAAD